MSLLIIFWTLFWCQVYHVDPAFALAVAHVESRAPGREFRTGLLAGKWYGPFNVHKDFRKRWPEIKTISGNCRIGVRALRGSNPRKILRRYNRNFNQAYFRAVIRAHKKYAQYREAYGKSSAY